MPTAKAHNSVTQIQGTVVLLSSPYAGVKSPRQIQISSRSRYLRPDAINVIHLPPANLYYIN